MRSARFIFPVIIILLFSVPSAGLNIYLEHQVQKGGGAVTALSFSPDGGLLAFGNREGNIYILDTESGAERAAYHYHGSEVSDLLFSPDGRYLVSSSADKTIKLKELGSEAPPANLERFEGRAERLAFSQDGRYLAGDGDDHDIFIWEIPSRHLRSRMKGHGDDILEIAFDQASGTLITVSDDRKMIIWELRSMKILRQYTLEARTIPNSGIDLTCAEVSGDRLFVAAGIDEHILRKGGRGMMFKYHIAFFDLENGMLLKVLEDNDRPVELLSIYPGNCFVGFDNSTHGNRKLALRNIETSEFALQYTLDGECTVLAFSPDGQRLAAAVKLSADSGDPVLYVWEVDYTVPASGCFMGRIRLTTTAEPVLGAGVPRAAAVLPFSVSGTEEDAGKAASHFMESRLSGSPYLKLVERARVNDIITELKFQQSELVDREKAAEIGRMLGAEYIITGNVDRVGADLVISARIVRVETGQILGTREVHCGQCGNDDIFDAVDILAPALVLE